MSMSKDEFTEEMKDLPDDSLIRILRWFHEELARRIKALDDAGALFTDKKETKNLKRVSVKFPNYWKVYVYLAPASARPGDVVLVPGYQQSLARIVPDKSNYDGPVKEVVALYKKEK